MNNELSLGINNNILLIIAKGEMRAKSCFSLKNILFQYLENTEKKIKIYIDLSQCKYMDSTFIGFIIGLESKCRDFNPKAVYILNPSDECKKELNLLSCLDKIKLKQNTKEAEIETFKVKTEECYGENNIDKLETIFSSHKTLSEINNTNHTRFKTLLDELKKAILRHKSIL